MFENSDLVAKGDKHYSESENRWADNANSSVAEGDEQINTLLLLAFSERLPFVAYPAILALAIMFVIFDDEDKDFEFSNNF